MTTDQGFYKTQQAGTKMVHNLEQVRRIRKERLHDDENKQATLDYIFGKSEENPNQDLVDQITRVEEENIETATDTAIQIKIELKKQRINK